MGITRDLIKNERPTIESPNATENNTFGIGQTWQNVTSQRSLGVTYTNNTGKPIFIKVSLTHSGTALNSIISEVDGVEFIGTATSVNNARVSDVLVVPIGSTYKITSSTNFTLFEWLELR